jgi:hypothetical protein
MSLKELRRLRLEMRWKLNTLSNNGLNKSPQGGSCGDSDLELQVAVGRHVHSHANWAYKVRSGFLVRFLVQL